MTWLFSTAQVCLAAFFCSPVFLITPILVIPGPALDKGFFKASEGWESKVKMILP
jgi:hypothetical protein